MANQKVREFLFQRISELPSSPGVYLFKDFKKNPVYIGKALSLKKRVQSHFRFYGENFSKEGHLLADTRFIDFIETPTEAEALLLESALVKENQPKYNQELKDDKSYPYLKITYEKFPRLVVSRGRKPDGGKYFGPYTSARLLRQAVSMLRRFFPMRTCRPMPNKVCLMYHIGQCKGPCVNEINEEQYAKIVKELESFLEGRRDAMVKNLFSRMREYSKERDYEKAQSLYGQIKMLSQVSNKKSQRFQNNSILELLKAGLSLEKLPNRMECFDISNISGKEAVGSMSVFVGGKPSKKDYKRFRIKTVEGIDDYRMMKEVLRRRYTRLLSGQPKDIGFQERPDLIVIDGGKGHLAAAKEALQSLGLDDLPVVSIAKQHEHIFSPDRDRPTVFVQSSQELQLIQRLRDEAHRFAITYHRKLHRREALSSELDEIKGVGPLTKEKLLRKIGPVSRIKLLDERTLIKKAGINENAARNIVLFFKKRIAS